MNSHVHPIIWVADIGSIKNNNFAWCRIGIQERGQGQCGTDIHEFANGIAQDLSVGFSVALGFECPLYVPVPADPKCLTKARTEEIPYPWSAGAGCASLACGLSETAWVFERIRESVGNTLVKPTFSLNGWLQGKANLLIWEALVTGPAKGKSHEEDARIAAKAFQEYLNQGCADADINGDVFSLVGAALLRSGLTTDLTFLRCKCLIVRADT